jgi:hypothetical protein
MTDRSPDDPPLVVELEVHLERRPPSGRLRTARGADEQWIGWLGFAEALKRVHDAEAARLRRLDSLTPERTPE